MDSARCGFREIIAMNKIRKLVIIMVVTFWISFALLPQALGRAAEIWLDFEGRTLSAQLSEAPLRQVIDRIKRERLIWIRRVHGSLNERVSVEFEDLSLRKGVERIFSSVNYSLVFDKYGRLAGVFLLGKPQGRWGKFRRRSIVRRKKVRRPPRRSRRRK
jgi:hypothetical protein